MPHDLPPLVTPDADDDEGTPQAPRKRLLGKAKVPTRPTRRERKQLTDALAHADDGDGTA